MAIAPSTGPTTGGTAVTITGTGFSAGATVKLGGTNATNVTVASSTSITATTPAHTAGVKDVQVTNTDNQSGTLTSGFTYTSTPSETVLLADDFNDNSLDPSKWTVMFPTGTPPVTEQAQQIRMTLAPNTAGYNGVSSNSTFDVTGKMVQVEVAQAVSQAGWAEKTAMNRGQVLYRVAELMEGRRDQFVAEVAAAEGSSAARAKTVVDRAIDRWVWYAGWADKISQVLGSSNPVSAPYFNFTIPEATGVIGIVAPETSSLLGLVSRLAPPLVAGNAVVVLASETRPLPAVTLSEVLATSDVPGGVVNLLTGWRKELVPVLAAHVDVDGLDTWGVPEAMRLETEQLAADDIKRLSRRPTTVSEARFDWLDDRAAERPEWIAAFLEMKTVWHPIGV